MFQPAAFTITPRYGFFPLVQFQPLAVTPAERNRVRQYSATIRPALLFGFKVFS
jgi:hypothetical protein